MCWKDLRWHFNQSDYGGINDKRKLAQKKKNTNKFINFGVDGVNVRQSTKLGVTKQIWDDYVPHSMGIHYNPLHTKIKKLKVSKTRTKFKETGGHFIHPLNREGQ